MPSWYRFRRPALLSNSLMRLGTSARLPVEVLFEEITPSTLPKFRPRAYKKISSGTRQCYAGSPSWWTIRTGRTRLRRERDLYLGFCRLAKNDLEPFLSEALGLSAR